MKWSYSCLNTLKTPHLFQFICSFIALCVGVRGCVYQIEKNNN